MRWRVLLGAAVLLIASNSAVAKKAKKPSSRRGNATTAAVVAALRDYVVRVVEPSLEAMTRNETQPERLALNPTQCFGTSPGVHLRSWCCVYFSNMAAALIEAHFGSLRPSNAQPYDTQGGSAPPPLPVAFELTAKWLLAHENDPFALGVRAERIRSVAELHAAAKRLPYAALGRYEASVTVAGVPGKLVKCEMGTVHTYLVFRPNTHEAVGAKKLVEVRRNVVQEMPPQQKRANPPTLPCLISLRPRFCFLSWCAQEVIVDVTYKQFVGSVEWMGDRAGELVDAAVAKKAVIEASQFWASSSSAASAASAATVAAASGTSGIDGGLSLLALPQFLVGTDEQVAAALTKEGLRDTMEALVEGLVGRSGGGKGDGGKGAHMAVWPRAAAVAPWPASARPWLDPGQLASMHAARNEVMMRLRDPVGRASFCGRPNQALATEKGRGSVQI